MKRLYPLGLFSFIFIALLVQVFFYKNVFGGEKYAKDRVLEAGDPISMNNGSYHFDMVLLNLGGLISPRADLLYRLGDWQGDGGFFHGFENTIEYLDFDTGSLVTVVLGTSGDEIQFTRDPETPEGHLIF